VKSVSSVAKVGEGDVGGERRVHVSGVCRVLVFGSRFSRRKSASAGGLTKHAESLRFRACAWRACASYVYVMRRRSWIVRCVVDIVKSLLGVADSSRNVKKDVGRSLYKYLELGRVDAHKYARCGWSICVVWTVLIQEISFCGDVVLE
jgi:hypothetical protein